MNGTKTQKHKSIFVMRIFRMIFFKQLDFLFLPFFLLPYMHGVIQMRLPLIYTFLLFWILTRFTTYNLEVVSFSFHHNDLARYIINKRTFHLSKYHDKIDQSQI